MCFDCAVSTAQGTPPEVPAGKVPLDFLLYMREDMSNTKLANLVGTNPQEISRMRRGMRPKLEMRKKIAEAMGVSQAYLGWEVEANV
jgi:Helix-turn-helix